MNFQHMLGKVGLTTREELTQAQAKKEIWHSLVRDVFARYYLKMREAFPDQLPDLPRKYSAGWEDHIKSELSNFLSTDLQDVDPLLRACGFGTEKWQQFVEETLPEMDAIVDSHLNGEIAIGRAPVTDRELAQELSEARKEIRQLRALAAGP